MNLQEVLLATFSIISSLVIVFVVVCLGWYLVWKLFLSRFKLVRELLGLMSDTSPSNTENDAKTSNTTTKARKVRRD